MSESAAARADLRDVVSPTSARVLRAAAPAAAQEAPTRHLRLAPAIAKHTGRNPVMVSLVAVGIILAIFAAQLGLSIAISQGAYEARALELEQRDLGRVERVLAQNVGKLSSPQNLAENAAKLGMVQNSTPASMRMSDGAVLGKLATSTTDPRGNIVPNSTLESMPVVDAAGLLVARGATKAPTEPAVRWKGKLPAPTTH